MQFYGQPQCTRGVKYPARLPQRERDVVAERIDRIGEACARHGRQDLVADEVDVGITAAGKFRWHRVRSKAGGRDLDSRLQRESARNPQLLGLVGDIEAVT